MNSESNEAKDAKDEWDKSPPWRPVVHYYDFDGLYGQEHEEVAEHIASILTRALQNSTKCDTIIIYDSPKIFHNTNSEKIRIVVEVIDIVNKIKLFKVRV